MAAILSSWLCTNSTKAMFVKIVLPGGHVELHDRPVFVSELLHRNPKCCVTQPTVFHQPWDIVSPDATLMPGEKYYVVPLSTIRKLQLRHSCKNLSGRRDIRFNPRTVSNKEKSQNWCLFGNKNSDDQMQDCSTCLLKGMKKKQSSSEEMNSTSGCASSDPNLLTRKKSNESSVGGEDLGGSGSDPPLKLTSLDNNWQPNLQTIREE